DTSAPSSSRRRLVRLNNLSGGMGQAQIDLPVHLDVTTARARLEALSCDAPVKARFNVVTSTARLCVGKLESPSGGFSTASSCATDLKDETLVSLLAIPLLRGKLHLPISQSEAKGPEWVQAGETARFEGKVELEHTTVALVSGITSLLPTKGGLLEWLVIGPAVAAVQPVLGPLLRGVTDLLVNDVLLKTLGITLNSADIHLSSIGCRHNARLVY
ncbi:hypothetical protein, partial [Verticiella alkaliphila]|uniref:hypothetical protein n=1 Tax=Verticiella alkaliphila TaxID=2779529 RepID=UPI001C0C65B6